MFGKPRACLARSLCSGVILPLLALLGCEPPSAEEVRLALLPEQEVADMAFIATVVTIGILGIIELPIALVIAGTKILADQKHFRSLAAAARGVEEAVG